LSLLALVVYDLAPEKTFSTKFASALGLSSAIYSAIASSTGLAHII